MKPLKTPTILLLLSAAIALSASASAFAFAFQQQGTSSVSHFGTGTASRPPLFAKVAVSSISNTNPRSLSLLSAHYASSDESTDVNLSFSTMARNRLRAATGFSFTVFRATLRGITGISLTTLYAGTLAATGLWIRKAMSAVLSLVPASFRYFLQPFLVIYYTPLILLRGLTSPTARKRAVAKHDTVVEAWKEAVTLAEKTEKSGYWPVAVSKDGYFELAKPPSVNSGVDINTKMAEAMAEAVEHAMKLKSKWLSNDDE